MNSFREHALMKCARVVNAHFEDSMVNSTRVVEIDSVDDLSVTPSRQKFSSGVSRTRKFRYLHTKRGGLRACVREIIRGEPFKRFDFESASRDKERKVANVTGLLERCAYYRDDASRLRQLGLFKMVRGAGEMRVCGYVLFYAEQTPVSRILKKCKSFFRSVSSEIYRLF